MDQGGVDRRSWCEYDQNTVYGFLKELIKYFKFKKKFLGICLKEMKMYVMYMNVNNIFHNRTEAYPNVYQLING